MYAISQWNIQVAEGKYLETHKLKTFSDKQDLKFTAQSPLVITKNILKKKVNINGVGCKNQQ